MIDEILAALPTESGTDNILLFERFRSVRPKRADLLKATIKFFFFAIAADVPCMSFAAVFELSESFRIRTVAGEF
jgi:hypothetical protein